MISPQPATLSGAELDRLMREDLRRTTLLAAWSFSLLYVCADLAIRLGAAAQIRVALWIAAGLQGALWLQILAFLIGLPVVWLLCYLADLSIEASGRRSWLYRMGNLAHSRVFLLIYLAALIIIAILGVQYGVALSSFWLIFALLLLSCLASLIEPGDGLRASLRDSWIRLTLLLVRLPLAGRMISLGGVNNQVEAGMASVGDDPNSAAADGVAEEPSSGTTAPSPGGGQESSSAGRRAADDK